ncbi:hypothetical protein [Streptomyces sp. NPDC101455]|uniref:glycine-rich domain-containing protein n=1 Tax=Streptomyces sp. NPDC101455 TaxID=3366142 RepID=UPI0037F92392
MSSTTGKGIQYPQNTDNTRLWEQFQALAQTADNVIFGKIDRQIFTASGTWTRPANAIAVLVQVQAAGGGAGGVASTGAGQAACAPGGSGGEYAEGWLTPAAAGATVAVTVGAGGTAAAAGANAGGDGGGSSFGALITCVGGSGSAGGTASATVSIGGPNGGTGGTGGDFRVAGGDGGNGQCVSSVPLKYNSGGYAFLGGARRSSGVAATTTTGFNGYAYGGGASGPANGVSQASVVGSAGAGGIVIVTTYTA